jgi:3-carboxy-cis,cis-muconate cycloisomerase
VIYHLAVSAVRGLRLTSDGELIRQMTMLDALFRSPVISAAFSDSARLQGMLDFEAALARAEAACGIIPREAASAIGAKCQQELFDVKALGENAAKAGNLAIPMIEQLTALVAKDHARGAGFVHWGATSQDAIDTGFLLQLRTALDSLQPELRQLCAILATLADKHRATPIAGRTWLQQALPTSFGVILAGWLDALLRHLERLQKLRERVLVLQFGGAVGTLAAFGEQGNLVAETLAKDLSLALPDIPWHGHRDRIAEIATTMGLLTGTLGKIARDISLHMQTEVGELREPGGKGRGGSSTMPQKRNPVACAVILSAAGRVPGLVSTALSAMIQENERGLGGWHAEWEVLPEIAELTGGAVHHLLAVISGLEVDETRMRENLEITQGLIYAEAVATALAPHVGKSKAHRWVAVACEKSIATHTHLRDALLAMPAILGYVPAEELAQLFDPLKYLGASGSMIDTVLASAKTFPQTSDRESE